MAASVCLLQWQTGLWRGAGGEGCTQPCCGQHAWLTATPGARSSKLLWKTNNHIAAFCMTHLQESIIHSRDVGRLSQWFLLDFCQKLHIYFFFNNGDFSVLSTNLKKHPRNTFPFQFLLIFIGMERRGEERRGQMSLHLYFPIMVSELAYIKPRSKADWPHYRA